MALPDIANLPFRVFVARALMTLVIAGSALAIGTAHTVVLCVVAVVLAVACAVSAFPNTSLRAKPAATLLFATAVGLTLFTAIQCLPLPPGLVAAIAPDNADVWARCLRPLGEEGPRWITISLDPTATHVQLLRCLVYLLTFVVSLRVASRRNGPTFLAAVIVGVGVVLAAAAVFHPLFGTRKIFGVYTPDPAVADRHIAPLVDPNHLAAYLNIALCLSIALFYRLRSFGARASLVVFGACLIMTQVWVASRGGVAMMIVAVPLVVVLTRASQRRSSIRKAALVFGPVALAVAAVAIFVLAVSDKAAIELADTDFTKLDLVRSALRLVPHHTWVGIGRGAFQSTFPVVQTRNGWWDYTHPENIVAQWSVEWGVPVSILAAGAIAIALRPSILAGGSSFAIGPWVAVGCTAVHNLADFSLEMPGVTIAITVCAALIVSGAPSPEPRAVHGWATRPSAVAVVATVATLAAAALAARGIGHELREERQALLAQMLETRAPRDRFVARARDALQRHPADPYLPLLGAIHASRNGEAGVVGWAARALERSPVYGHAHYVIARELARRSRAQARLEYRLAMEQDSSLIESATRHGVQLVEGLAEARELIPNRPSAPVVIERIVELVSRRLPGTATELDADLATRAPADTRPLERSLHAVDSDLGADQSAPWCAADREACARTGLAVAERYVQTSPRLCAGHVYAARFTIAAGEPRRALEELRDIEPNVDDRSECLKALATLARQVGNPEMADAALEKLSRVCGTSDAECVENTLFAAHAHEAHGNPRLALLYYRRAAERAPQRTDVLEHVAALAARIGLPGEAVGARRALGKLGASDAGVIPFDFTPPRAP